MASKDRYVTLFVVDRFEFKDKDTKAPQGKGFELRVVHVISQDQKSRGAEVQKVYFYENGQKTIMKGLQAKDLSKLKDKWLDVKHYLDNPGPVPPLPLPEALGGGEGLGGGGLGGESLGAGSFAGTDLGKPADDF